MSDFNSLFSLSPPKIPLSLYIHIPWCIKKCPYCDFNSHQIREDTEFAPYVDALIIDAKSQIDYIQGREISSIFVGGGTPSLLPIPEYQRLFSTLKDIYDFADDIEVTMEANPATIEHAPFEQYLEVGINRLSIGVQTFNSDRLETLGRIHNANQARVAVDSAKKAGFKRINVDLMHGLPKQSVNEAMYDIEQAISVGATHISWYQLTIEPNTVFYRTQPILPDEDVLAEIEEQGSQKLIDQGFYNYEVSAWRGKEDRKCRHNVNYWQFGDYLAIGAGGHGKVTLVSVDGYENGIYRYNKPRTPRDYMRYDDAPKMLGWQTIKDKDIAGEFMLDALRLTDGVSVEFFLERTGRSLREIETRISRFKSMQLLVDSDDVIKTTSLGRRYLNRIISEFI